MHIHFVCVGNTYRSRLAEAYLKSKKIPDVTVSSSGIEAKDNICGPICWEAQRLIEVGGLVPHMSPTWTQTTEEILSTADEVVFMEQQQFDYAKQQCNFTSNNYSIWNISDLDELQTLTTAETIEKTHLSEKTFIQIKLLCDALAEKYQPNK